MNAIGNERTVAEITPSPVKLHGVPPRSKMFCTKLILGCILLVKTLVILDWTAERLGCLRVLRGNTKRKQDNLILSTGTRLALSAEGPESRPSELSLSTAGPVVMGWSQNCTGQNIFLDGLDSIEYSLP